MQSIGLLLTEYQTVNGSRKYYVFTFVHIENAVYCAENDEFGSITDVSARRTIAVGYNKNANFITFREAR